MTGWFGGPHVGFKPPRIAWRFSKDFLAGHQKLPIRDSDMRFAVAAPIRERATVLTTENKMYAGKIPFPNPDGSWTQIDNKVFDLELKFSETITPSKKAPSRQRHVFVDRLGAKFHVLPMEYGAILAAYPKITTEFVAGRFEFTRRGNTYGLKLSGQVPQVAQPAKPVAAAPVATPQPITGTKRNRFQICLDRSASMAQIRREAVVDALNTILKTIRDQARQTNQPTTISIWEFGGGVYRTHANMNAETVQPFTYTQYQPNGSNTPLFECLGQAIESERADADPDTSHFVYMITDGEENASTGRLNPTVVNSMIANVQATDRWTFAIQMPNHAVDRFVRGYSIPAGNVQGWDLTDQGITKAALSTSSGVGSYFSARSTGLRSVKNVYQISLAAVKIDDVRARCQQVTGHKVWKVEKEQDIKDFVEQHAKTNYVIGSAWYQLTKPEVVQPYKGIMLRHKITKEIFGGPETKSIIGVDPANKDTFKVVPALLNEWDVFVTSSSVNRKLVRGTDVIYIPVQHAMPETWDSAAAKAAADAKKAQPGSAK